ncbi:NAD-dependent epimerase/dehydratase family protein [Salinibacter ruber]|uniref:NAD-dependent epimerase/dehydratase family protein n=1 Tax=Salinibacter ruber TaxID=146919 RepID=UPI00207354F3|nr:NAD-dependent epimerase/dehydratase family protein [Salinibacter ruber]
MMRILVTGGCGYIGSQLLRDLPEHFEEEIGVRVLDNLQGGRPEALMDLPDGCDYEFIEGDVLDPSVQRAALRDVDAVIHLAAIVQTPLSFDDPNWVEQVNHWGTSHLLEACLEEGVKDFIFASSAAVYGPGGPYDEEDPCDPMGAYAESKQKAEEAVRSADRRGLRATVLRLGTAYGQAPVTRYEAVANRFALLAGTGRPLTIFGEGTQTRPFIHVRDAGDVLCWALSRRDRTAGQTLNVIEQNASVMDLVAAVKKAFPDADTRRTEQDVRTHLSFELDDKEIRSLGWTPSETLADGLGELIGGLRGFSSPAHLNHDSVATEGQA